MRLNLVVSALTVAVVACSSNDLTGVAAANLGEPGLDQYVVLATPIVAVGDSVSARSVVVNRGSTPVTVVFDDGDGLSFSGVAFVVRPDTLPRLDNLVSWRLMPGDSLVTKGSSPPVTAVPGDYPLAVQQVLIPGASVRVTLRVVPRP